MRVKSRLPTGLDPAKCFVANVPIGGKAPLPVRPNRPRPNEVAKSEPVCRCHNKRIIAYPGKGNADVVAARPKPICVCR